MVIISSAGVRFFYTSLENENDDTKELKKEKKRKKEKKNHFLGQKLPRNFMNSFKTYPLLIVAAKSGALKNKKKGKLAFPLYWSNQLRSRKFRSSTE